MTLQTEQKAVYAGFRQRFVASMVDALVFVPIFALQFLAYSVSPKAVVYSVVSVSILANAYSIYFHGRFGQTLCKMTTKIKVMKLIGEEIGMQEALKRSSVDVIFFSSTRFHF